MRIFYAFLIALALSGCSVLQDIDTDTRQLAVQYATLKVINGDLEKRERVIELVERGRTYVTASDEITIAAIEARARDFIRWDNIDPADQMLIDAILLQARDRLQSEIGVGLLDDEQKAKVLTVLDWIERAAHGP